MFLSMHAYHWVVKCGYLSYDDLHLIKEEGDNTETETSQRQRRGIIVPNRSQRRERLEESTSKRSLSRSTVWRRVSLFVDNCRSYIENGVASRPGNDSAEKIS